MLLGELVEMRETGGEWEVRGAAPLGHLWQLCTVVALKILAKGPQGPKSPTSASTQSLKHNAMLCGFLFCSSNSPTSSHPKPYTSCCPCIPQSGLPSKITSSMRPPLDAHTLLPRDADPTTLLYFPE